MRHLVQVLRGGRAQEILEALHRLRRQVRQSLGILQLLLARRGDVSDRLRRLRAGLVVFHRQRRDLRRQLVGYVRARLPHLHPGLKLCVEIGRG